MTRKIRKKITVTTQFSGCHKWPKAPASVAFLRDLHRHIFGVSMTLAIKEDRELEFFTVQKRLNEFIGKELIPFLQRDSSLSCESMAEVILVEFADLDAESVTVSEDGENSSTVYFE